MGSGEKVHSSQSINSSPSACFRLATVTLNSTRLRSLADTGVEKFSKILPFPCLLEVLVALAVDVPFLEGIFIEEGGSEDLMMDLGLEVEVN